jgi:hypothetical protein
VEDYTSKYTLVQPEAGAVFGTQPEGALIARERTLEIARDLDRGRANGLSLARRCFRAVSGEGFE